VCTGKIADMLLADGQKVEFHTRQLRPTETGRGSEGPMLIWTLKAKFCWELKFLVDLNHLSG